MTKIHKHVIRSIVMDGGGLYGLSTTIMLRKLCEGDKNFMRLDSAENKVTLFAGTSAGALNALLLANSPNPREFILSGGLENFWRNGFDISGNKNPVNAWLSLWGLSSWYGSEDFMNYLDSYFGNRTISSLPGKVLVFTFDWYGDPKVNEAERSWGSKIFSNYANFGQDWKIKDVAYSAASPPPYRATINGLGDAAVVANNPSVLTYSFVKSHFHKPQAILSLGICAKVPSYGWQKFNFGNLPFSLLSTNLCQGNWLPPAAQVWVTGVSETSTLETGEILRPSYYRLDPPLLGPPNPTPSTLAMLSLTRFYPWFCWVINAIDKAVETPMAQKAVDKCLAFLESQHWNCGEAYTWPKHYDHYTEEDCE